MRESGAWRNSSLNAASHPERPEQHTHASEIISAAQPLEISVHDHILVRKGYPLLFTTEPED
jgi:hypothetical protein